MTIVYLYTALCTVGGADRSIIQKANYLADEMHQDVFIITDSQKERPPVFPISPRIRHIDIGIDFDRQYHHNLLVRGYYYFTLMHLYRKKLEYWLKTLKPDIVISTLGRELDFLTRMRAIAKYLRGRVVGGCRLRRRCSRDSAWAGSDCR